MVGKGFRRAVRCRNTQGISLAKPEMTEFRAADPNRVFEHRREDGRKCSCRARNDLEHVGGSGLSLERFTQLAQEPRVLDRDNSLRGESFEQR